MFKDIKQIRNFIKWCRKNGVTKATIGDISFEVQPEMETVQEIPLSEVFKKLDSGLDIQPSRSNGPSDLEEPTKTPDGLTDEERDLLFWSSGR
jgi:hypothetical protein